MSRDWEIAPGRPDLETGSSDPMCTLLISLDPFWLCLACYLITILFSFLFSHCIMYKADFPVHPHFEVLTGEVACGGLPLSLDLMALNLFE